MAETPAMDELTGRSAAPAMNSDDKDRIVIGQHPPGGCKLPKGSTVRILVGERRSLESVKMPTEIEIQWRQHRWLAISQCPLLLSLQGDSYFFTINIQQLGNMDCKLLREDIRALALSKDQRKTPQEQAASFEHFGLCSLWVIGAFAVISALEKQLEQQKIRYNLKGRVHRAKMQFLRLRSPFAKAKASQETDFPYPYSAGKRGTVTWAVDSKTFVSRAELSIVLMDLLWSVARLWPYVNERPPEQLKRVVDAAGEDEQDAPRS